MILRPHPASSLSAQSMTHGPNGGRERSRLTVEERDAAVVAAIDNLERPNTADIQRQTGLSTRSLGRDLRRLRDAGVIEFVGSPRQVSIVARRVTLPISAVLCQSLPITGALCCHYVPEVNSSQARNALAAMSTSRQSRPQARPRALHLVFVPSRHEAGHRRDARPSRDAKASLVLPRMSCIIRCADGMTRFLMHHACPDRAVDKLVPSLPRRGACRATMVRWPLSKGSTRR